MDEVLSVEEKSNEAFYKKYKIHLSVAAAIVVVGVSALAHYKNEKVKEELLNAISGYQEGLLLSGGELKHGAVGCSGIITTDCEIEGIDLSIMGQKQLSIRSLRLGNVEELSKLKAFSEGKRTEASFDIEADEVALPKPILAQMITQNVSNAFQQNTMDKLSTVNFALKGNFEGSVNTMSHLNIDHLRIDNTIMPLEFSMRAREVSSSSPDSMILDHFSLTLENRTISDVTYASVKSFTDTLQNDEKGVFLKEFNLTPSEMNDQKKASQSINTAIAKHFEVDLPKTPGIVEKDLIRAMIQMLKGEIKEITLDGKNQKELSMIQLQNALQQSSGLSDEDARKFMNDKFKIDVETD